MTDLLRHTLATLAYRGGKTVRDAPPSFADFRGGGRTPLQIISHINDLLDWSACLARGEKTWNDTKPESWDAEVQRFFGALERLDGQIASQPLQCKEERLFQGPIADALTHVGQLAMLRRMAGAPIRGENYYVADIQAGRVGEEQAEAKRPFEQ